MKIMDADIFNDFFSCAGKAFIFLLILLPFGIWKLIEIIIWLFHHISFN